MGRVEIWSRFFSFEDDDAVEMSSRHRFFSSPSYRSYPSSFPFRSNSPQLPPSKNRTQVRGNRVHQHAPRKGSVLRWRAGRRPRNHRREFLKFSSSFSIGGCCCGGKKKKKNKRRGLREENSTTPFSLITRNNQKPTNQPPQQTAPPRRPLRGRAPPRLRLRPRHADAAGRQGLPRRVPPRAQARLRRAGRPVRLLRGGRSGHGRRGGVGEDQGGGGRDGAEGHLPRRRVRLWPRRGRRRLEQQQEEEE